VGVWVVDQGDVIIPGPVPIDLGSGRYVALGDSFSAGEGLEPFIAGTQDTNEGGDRCHRSERFAYALLLTFVEETKTVFRACSGAKVANVFDTTQEHSGVLDSQGLQVGPGIAGNDVTLVTLTMGGNDIDFAKALSFCFSNGPNCSELPYKGYEHLSDWVDAGLSQLKLNLIGLYERLRAAFPRARILVLGYPSLFPVKASPIYDVRRALCTTLFEAWTAPEREAIRNWGFSLNRVILEATQAAGAGIEYVDISSHFAGHEPCSTGGEWVRFVGLLSNAVRDSSFHPLADGYRMMARIVSCHLDIFPAVDTPRTKGTNYAMTGCVAKEIVEVAATPETAVPT
jgi:lysophospholipase L1-like esterase